MVTENKLGLWKKFEDFSLTVSFGIISLMLIGEIVMRQLYKSGLFHLFGIEGISGISQSNIWVSHLLFLITSFGFAITQDKEQHLNIALGLFKSERAKSISAYIRSSFSSFVLTMLLFSSLLMTFSAFDDSEKVWFIKIKYFVLFFPINFFVTLTRAIKCEIPRVKNRNLLITVNLIMIALAIFFALGAINDFLYSTGSKFTMPEAFYNLRDAVQNYVSKHIAFIIILFCVSLIFESPLFIVFGGIGMFLYIKDAIPLSVIPYEGYSLITSQAIPTIALFTLTGFILSESKAGERLVLFFSAFFSWLPGGVAIAVVLVSAFFTTFTGASGVTILALGSLMVMILRDKKEYDENYSIGLVSSTGSVGLFFPPSLAIILYASTAQIPINQLFLGSLIPGIFLVITLSLTGVFLSLKNKDKIKPFDFKKAGSSFVNSFWELSIPVVLAISYFKGITNLTETSALSVLYAAFIEIVIRQDIKFKELKSIIRKATIVIGGILSILFVTRGLSSYMIDAEIPQKLSNWVKVTIQNKYVFLIFLNLFLIIVGCFLDIFSAILIVSPLIIPTAQVYGIDPIHLAVIFLLNLEIGYITPPVGLNLFLSSYRFQMPLTKIYKSIVPFILIQLVALIVITYAPSLSLILIKK